MFVDTRIELSGRESGSLTPRPGITGPATLYLRDEERLLLDVIDRQDYYDSVLYPLKVRIDLDYLERWSLKRDIAYLAVTALPRLDRILKVIPSPAMVAELENGVTRSTRLSPRSRSGVPR